MAERPEVAGELAAMAELCRRVAAGELGAVAAAPFPAAFARQALDRAAATAAG